ncbi:MAG: DUF4375 domain-containing protein [Phycisphaerales bacterium]|nr:DUF4375 domain-containing protein [Phycisphaerales bacterium]
MRQMYWNKYDVWYPSRKQRRQKRDCRISRKAFDRANNKCVAVVERAAAFVRQTPGDIGETESRFYKLSKARQVMLPIVELAEHMNDDGFLAYFYDEACWFTAYAVQGLERIGADDHLQVLRQAKRVFPDGKVPRNNLRRTAMLPKCDIDWWKGLKPCDMMRERLSMPRLDWEILKRIRKVDIDWRQADQQEGPLPERYGLKYVMANLDAFVS